ncbi:uncharacterized protein FOMMEDRAFT_167197 [Fomitiporia mediterranea MF3/22]|uniref:uncharacterized protein n=1 Tax=Fomitiporia mediterranea (strain MF3/22) TaxID=694068 RepID=UPI0004407DB1|nr:uncharacterized protein FOMMEDRAFT_167197 [Fomitiporia mediterranea MF3/22]EJD03889.1 hypothetical protein FOMMEDRAFT_167197 [Fomitiporia mediterranea MF3/22]
MLPNNSPSVSQMLSEIKTETASQVSSPPGSTGLPGLDIHLITGTNTGASPSSSLNRGDVIEIQGPAASGKTRLTYHFVIQCILPRQYHLPPGNVHTELDVGGWEKVAIIMDTDGRWNVQRLISLLIQRVEKSLLDDQIETRPIVSEIVSKSMQRLHIFRPKTSASLAATLFRLPSYHAEHLPTQEIALLVIDSISTFYWIDRYSVEQRHGASDRKDIPNPLSRVLIALQEFRLSHSPVILLTNWGLSPASKSSVHGRLDEPSAVPSPFYRQHLHPFPAPFENPPRILPNAHLLPPITHHITLIQPSINNVASEATNLQEALDLAARWVGTKDEIMGLLRTVETGRIANFTVRDGDVL